MNCHICYSCAGHGHDRIYSTLHLGPSWQRSIFNHTHAVSTANTLSGTKTFAEAFHTFGLYWDQNQLYTYIGKDSNRLLQVNFTSNNFQVRQKHH